MFFVLGFLNTTLATTLIRQINPTANNSANYMKRIPFAVPTDEELARGTSLVQSAIDLAHTNGQAPDELQAEIESFYRSIWCNTGAEAA